MKNFLQKNELVNITVNGKKYSATKGQSVAITLSLNKFKNLRVSPKLKNNRGFYCMIGSCQECLITINDEKQLACLTKVTNDMKIEISAKNE